MMELSLSKSLVNKDGIWHLDKENNLSYPEDANDLYFQIEDSSFWFQHRNRCLVSLIQKYSKNEVFYDIGGGNGAVTFAVQKSGIPSVLVEPGIKGCKNARNRGVENVACTTFQDAIDANRPIRSVGMFDVLEHIKDESQFLDELSEKMAANAKLYVTVPAYNSLWSVEDDQVGHFRRYTLKNLNDVLSKSGFSVEYQTYLFSFLPVPIFLFRSLPTKLGFSRVYNDSDTISKEHGNNSTPFVFNWFMNWELQRVSTQSSIPFGSSCLVVATKTTG